MLDGRWAQEAVIREAGERREAERQWLAQWRPRLEELRKELQQRSASQRAAAAKSLGAIRDPRAMPAPEAVFFEHSLETALLAIEALAEMPEQEAAQSLVRHAVFSPWPAAREAAAKGLEPRPPESYVPLLLAQLHTPVVSRAAVVPAGSGRLVYRHGFLREGQDQRELLILDTEHRRVALPEGDGRETLVRALGNSWATANAREYTLARQNQVTRVLNDRIVQALLDLGPRLEQGAAAGVGDAGARRDRRCGGGARGPAADGCPHVQRGGCGLPDVFRGPARGPFA